MTRYPTIYYYKCIKDYIKDDEIILKNQYYYPVIWSYYTGMDNKIFYKESMNSDVKYITIPIAKFDIYFSFTHATVSTGQPYKNEFQIKNEEIYELLKNESPKTETQNIKEEPKPTQNIKKPINIKYYNCIEDYYIGDKLILREGFFYPARYISIKGQFFYKVFYKNSTNSEILNILLTHKDFTNYFDDYNFILSSELDSKLDKAGAIQQYPIKKEEIEKLYNIPSKEEPRLVDGKYYKYISDSNRRFIKDFYYLLNSHTGDYSIDKVNVKYFNAAEDKEINVNGTIDNFKKNFDISNPLDLEKVPNDYLGTVKSDNLILNSKSPINIGDTYKCITTLTKLNKNIFIKDKNYRVSDIKNREIIIESESENLSIKESDLDKYFTKIDNPIKKDDIYIYKGGDRRFDNIYVKSSKYIIVDVFLLSVGIKPLTDIKRPPRKISMFNLEKYFLKS